MMFLFFYVGDFYISLMRNYCKNCFSFVQFFVKMKSQKPFENEYSFINRTKMIIHIHKAQE